MGHRHHSAAAVQAQPGAGACPAQRPGGQHPAPELGQPAWWHQPVTEDDAMTMPTGLLEWGQAGQFNAIDDRSAIAALWASAGGLPGLVSPPTLTAGSGLAITMGPWSAIVDCGDGTKAVIGSRAASTFNETAGGASARVDVLWADINPDNATWTLAIITEAAVVGRSGCFLGRIFVPASASTSAAMQLNPGNARMIGPWGRAQVVSNGYGGTGWGTLASMNIPAYDSDV